MVAEPHKPGTISRGSVVVNDRPSPPSDLASDRIIVLCPECGDRMRFAPAAPPRSATDKSVHFDCVCGYALQQPVASL